MKILVLNCGSSSLKYQLIDSETEGVLAKGLCERIGIDGVLKHEPAGKEKYVSNDPLPDHATAVKAVMDALVDADHGVIASTLEIGAVGHRVVHGGEYFASSVLITEEVKEALRKCIDLAPLHNPANIIGIEACEKIMPGIPMNTMKNTKFVNTVSTVQATDSYLRNVQNLWANPLKNLRSLLATLETVPASVL